MNITALIEQVKKENAQKHMEFRDEDLEQIRAIVVARIRQFAKDSAALVLNPALPAILNVWKLWGGSAEEVNAFVAGAINTDSDLVSFIDNFIFQTHSTAGRVLTTKNRLSMKALSESMDLNDVASRLDKIAEESLGPEKREVLRVARLELQRFRSGGLAPEQFDADRFFD